MKRLVVLGSLAGVFAACNPDIPTSGVSTYVIAQFDPSNSVVPTPTILVYDTTARRLAVPLAPGASPAQADFVAFLNSLDGYPEDTPGKVTFSDMRLPGASGGVDPASINPSTVLIIDVTPGSAPAPVAGASALLASPTQMTIVPPATGWPAGRLIAVVLIGGDAGLKGVGSVPVVGSPVWGLVKSKSSLVTCTTLFLPDGSVNPDCQPTVTVIPSNEHDPAARLQDQARSAVQLERLRLLYAPLLDALEAQNIPRANVALAWTFPVTTRPQVPFDPARSVIPFPNDIVRATLPDGGRRVSLPIPDAGTLPDGGVPDIVQLYIGLNTLDGFSTTAPIVSVFNADTVGALNQGKLDAGSLVPGAGWGFSRVTGSPGHTPTTPVVTPCLDCASSLLDGGTPNHPQRLQFIPSVPLDERTTYGVYLTTKLTDAAGRGVIPSSAFALLRSANPLYDGTHTTVDLITDDQAQQLEQIRVGMKPFIDSVANALGGRSNIALAWAFTTQTEVTALAGLNALPSAPALAPLLPANPLFVAENPPSSHILVGEIVTPEILNGPGGTLSPTSPTFRRVPVLVLIPFGGTPPYAVTIYGHGLTRSRTDALALASELTMGPFFQAVIATDVVWHGDRSFCVGSLAYLRTLPGISPTPTDDNDACVVLSMGTTQPGKCDKDPASASFGRCIAVNATNRAACTPGGAGDAFCSDTSRRQGLCLADMKCEGGDFRRASDVGGVGPTPLISGWNILNLNNIFATRDNFRQQVVDLAQLSRVISATGASSLGGQIQTILGLSAPALDSTRVNYAGQSLGGILGTLYTSVATNVHNVVLNVPGGDPGNILLTSPAFAGPRTAFLNTLAGQGLTPGTIGFDTFIGIAKWILDPADPQNMAYSVLHPGQPMDRKALVQYITQDQVVPNPTTVELINAGNRQGVSGPFDVCLFNPSTTDLPLELRHGFLINNAFPTVTMAAQSQLATYVTNGTFGGCP